MNDVRPFDAQPPAGPLERASGPVPPGPAAEPPAPGPPTLEPAAPSACEPTWSVRAAVGLVAVMVAATVVSGIVIAIVRAVGLAPSVESAVSGLVLAAVYLLVLLAVWLVARRKGVGFGASVGLAPVGARTLLAYGLGIAVAGRFIETLWAVALGALGVRLPGADLDPTQVFGEGPVAALMLAVVGIVIAPAVEEIVFRGILLPALERRWSTGTAVVASSLAFAVIHVSPFAIVPIFGLSLLLAFAFVRTRSLWVPIAAHAMFNGTAIGLLYLVKAF